MKVHWWDVPGFFDFQDVYDRAVELAPDGATFVEVGCLFGRSTIYLAQRIKDSGKGIKLYAVDPWEPWPDNCGNHVGNKYRDYIEKYGDMYDAFRSNVIHSGLDEFIFSMRMPSRSAATMFPKAHFVFIDGDHRYEEIKADIEAWLPVLDKSGYLAGHDYDWDDVKRAVDERFGIDGIETMGKSWIAKHA
jgi:hypothetical protein